MPTFRFLIILAAVFSAASASAQTTPVAGKAAPARTLRTVPARFLNPFLGKGPIIYSPEASFQQYQRFRATNDSIRHQVHSHWDALVY